MLSLWRSPLSETAASLLYALDAAPAAVDARDVHTREVNVQEDDSAYTLRLLVPGLKADDIALDVTASSISLRGQRTLSVPDGFRALRTERRPYALRRTLRFRHALDPDAVQATLKDGVLTVVLPKSDAKDARRVEIQG